jgi:hypothetical protein
VLFPQVLNAHHGRADVGFSADEVLSFLDGLAGESLVPLLTLELLVYGQGEKACLFLQI